MVDEQGVPCSHSNGEHELLFHDDLATSGTRIASWVMQTIRNILTNVC
jgi:hypothetical protein